LTIDLVCAICLLEHGNFSQRLINVMNMTPPALREYIFFFDDIDTEIEKKLSSLRWSDARAEELFALFIEGTDFDVPTKAACYGLYEAVSKAYQSANNTMNHPLRVMLSVALADAKPTYDSVTLGLCHNIREVGKGALDDIEQKFLSASVRADIKSLTIERRLERDHAYMQSYYGGIEDRGLTRFKGFDKLDNFLGFVCRDVDEFYYDVVERFECPGLAVSMPVLGDYLQRVSHYARETEVRERYAPSSGK